MESVQLWLTVFEDHRLAEWPPTIDGQRWRVALNSSTTIQGCAHEAPYRTSPVFPASASFVCPELAGNSVRFYFFCFDPAFPVLGRLLQLAPPEITSGLLFSVGLASVIYVASDVKNAEKIEQIAGTGAKATEIWTVDDGRIVAVDCTCQDPIAINHDLLKVQPYESLMASPRSAVDEFVSSIALVVPKIAVHMQAEVGTFVKLVRRVDELVAEMIYASQPMGDPPSTLSEYLAEDFTRDAALAETILHQNTDRIIQINAALSYLSTQALSGAVPILERRSLIRRYSLLGVGTATLALTRIARSIENAFSAGALETVLGERAGEAGPLPGIGKLPDYDAHDWTRLSISRWDGKVETRESYPKLPYFSGRLGFREGEYTISAALQSIATGAGPEWSLLTLTHEMLHGHVRNILSILLQADPARRPELKWQEFYDRYRAHVTQGPPVDQTFVESLRIVLLAYCCLTITHGSLTRETDLKRKTADSVEIRAEFWLPRKEALWLILEGELRNISEILVHVFDLHYFYRSSLSAYIPLIWRSWSPLPQVTGDLRQYLLRSLLVVAAKTKGTAYERFTASRSRLRELLEPIANGATPGKATIRSAVAILSSDLGIEALFYPFRASLILVDLADKVLTSNVIRGSLNSGDGHVQFRRNDVNFEEWFEYNLSDDFVDDRVVAPTAYLADRLAKKLGQPETSSLEQETVKLFLACCSHVEIGGRPNAGH